MPNQIKPPVVTIMGHVDHGKTTLLDAIRHSKITSQEFGGITQHVGAYQVIHQNKKITFIDTPGHAAFTKMRARGAQATDLVVLVVAVNDGVKPQTKESLAHIKDAGVPFLVALTKIDLPNTDSNMAKAQLAEAGVLVEGFGGQVVCVEVSAKTNQGVDQLLEMILLLSEVSELKSEPNALLQAVVIESSLDQQKGPVATVIVKKGTLHKGDLIQAEHVAGKVRSILQNKVEEVKSIGPGDPGQILGFKDVPPVGSIVSIMTKDSMVKEEKQYKRPYRHIIKKEVLKEAEDNKDKEPEKTKIKLIIKADTQGTLEAIKSNLPEEIELVYGDTGVVSESDVLLAQASNAHILAFNVAVDSAIEKMAELEGIKIKQYNIIYKLFEDLEERVLEWLEPTINEEQYGEAKVIAEFTIKKRHIAGLQVIKGKLVRSGFFRIKRGEKVIAQDLRVRSFQKERQDVEEVSKGDEVGVVFKPDVDFWKDDVIISYNKTK